MTNKELFNFVKNKRGSISRDNCNRIIDRSIQTIEIPSVSSIGEFAFANCKSLKSVTIPDSVTRIEARAFDSCSGLINVTIPDSVKFIGYAVFLDCKNLTSIEIPDSATIIGSWAFRNCISLTSVTIGNSVTSIGEYAFFYCGKLENVTLENGFAGNGLDLSTSTKFSVDTMIAMFNALADLTGQQAKTLTLGSTNLAKLTNEQIAIATEKNWTLA